MRIQSMRSIVIVVVFLVTCQVVAYSYHAFLTSEVSLSSGTIYGEVMDSLTTSGEIQTNQTWRNVDFGMIMFDDDNNSSYFQLTIWNVSSLHVENEENGTDISHDYPMMNQSMNIRTKRVMFGCWIDEAHLYINYTGFNARNDGGYFAIHPFFSSFVLNGELGHGKGLNLDFNFGWAEANASFGSESLYIQVARFSFPENQSAMFSINACGGGWIMPTPTVIVNGTLQAHNFKETSRTGIFIRYIGSLHARSEEITIVTEREPQSDYVDNDTMRYLVPWSIEIRIKVESRTPH